MSSKGAMTDMRSFIGKGRLLALVAGVLAVLAVVPAVAAAQQFGLASFSTSESSTQAGAHADFTTAFALNTDALGNPVGQLKDVREVLPQGVIGNPQAIAKCSDQNFQAFNCPADSQVGVLNLSIVVCRGVSTTLSAPAEAGALTVTVANGSELCGTEGENEITIGTGASAEKAHIAYVNGNELALEAPLAAAHAGGEVLTHVATPVTAPVAVFNMQPSPGHVATFGASLTVGTLLIQADLSSEGDYTLDASVNDISTLISIQATSLTLWGVPADPSHNALRCGQLGVSCGPAGAAAAPFMNNPADCGTPGAPNEPTSSLTVDSWQEPSQTVTANANLATPTGCEALAVNPSIAVTPDTTQADTPAGYDIDLHVPQNLDPHGLVTPDLKNVSVTLPAGTALSPGVANGLQGCTNEQFTAESCPAASKVGTADVSTPLLPDYLTGGVYVGTPTASEMYRIFVVVSGDNATVRLDGHVEPDPVTGQVTTVFEDNPQLPFENFDLKLFGGSDAALVNPTTCGPATTTSAIESFAGQTATPSSTFDVGGACAASQPFEPSFSAGTTDPVAGGFSPFTLTVSRGDGQQRLSTISAQMPAGLLGVLKSVTQCPEPQAAQGACDSESLIGHVTVGAGAGNEPFYVSGQVFLTGPYKGAPFGLSIVVPAIAGPYNLGTVVTRAQITVNPQTAQLTATSDPLPSILQGVPLDLRTVNVTIERPGFTFNPTNCEPLAIVPAATSTQGAGAGGPLHFQVAGCAGLSFKPGFSAATAGKASRANGASLDVKITAKGGPQAGSSEANIKSVKVTLPKQLPSRLSTLRQACTEAQFDANPAGCPAASNVGTASAVTPILLHPLLGPAYLVSHGGAAFPDLEIILQGEGIELVLDGKTNIKNGITSSTFETVPDAPISSFELKLPTGPYSVLAANVPASSSYSLCGQTLSMPTTITGQNGAVVTQITKIAPGGCVKTKRTALRREQKRAKALEACVKKSKSAKRAACEAKVRKQYARTKKAGKASHVEPS